MSFCGRVFQNLLRGKTRSLLTVIGITVGVFAVVVISAIGTIGSSEISGSLSTMGIYSIMVQTEKMYSDVTLTSEDVESLSRLSGVSKAMPLMSSTTSVTMLGKNTSVLSFGVSNQAKEIISLEAIHGRLITDSDLAANSRVCVIDEELALSSYGRSNVVGKTARIIFGGAYHDFEIVGVATSGLTSVQSVLSGFMPNFVYVPFTTMQSLTGRSTYDIIAVLVSGARQGEIATLISDRLISSKGVDGGITATNLLGQKEQLLGILDTATLALSAIAGISLFVSGLTVMTTMLVSVGERHREIGIKKAIGARSRDIMLEFLIESVTLSVIGCAVGIILGLLVTFVGCNLLGLGFAVNFGSLVAVTVFSVGFGTVFGVYPAAKAAKLDPIEALRN